MANESNSSDRVQIIDPDHPHFEEYGRFTGQVIRPIWGGTMALIELEHCRHGGDSCYVSPGQIVATRKRGKDGV